MQNLAIGGTWKLVFAVVHIVHAGPRRQFLYKVVLLPVQGHNASQMVY